MSSETPVTHALAHLLADSYTLYLKTQNFHWNVTGPQFFQLHSTFEIHYTELATAIDAIAERIRALGVLAPGSFTAFRELATIQECNSELTASNMIQSLNSDLEIIGKTAQALIKVASEAGDEVSTDLGVQRAALHSKQAWMLKSLLES